MRDGEEPDHRRVDAWVDGLTDDELKELQQRARDAADAGRFSLRAEQIRLPWPTGTARAAVISNGGFTAYWRYHVHAEHTRRYPRSDQTVRMAVQTISLQESYRRSGSSPLDVISFGESAVADEGASDAGEGQEVLGFALVAAVQSAASGEPGHRALYGPAVAAQACRGLDALACDAVPDTAPA